MDEGGGRAVGAAAGAGNILISLAPPCPIGVPSYNLRRGEAAGIGCRGRQHVYRFLWESELCPSRNGMVQSATPFKIGCGPRGT